MGKPHFSRLHISCPNCLLHWRLIFHLDRRQQTSKARKNYPVLYPMRGGSSDASDGPNLANVSNIMDNLIAERCVESAYLYFKYDLSSKL